MEKAVTFLSRFQNPMLWIALFGSFWWFNGEMGQIRQNEETIKVVEARQTKKILIQNEHERMLRDHEVNFLKYQLKQKDELHRLELEIIKQSLR